MIVAQPKEAIAQFVAERCGLPNQWGGHSCLAKVDENGIVVGVVYNHFTPREDGLYQDCCMHVASRPGSKWADRDFLFHAYNYPFNQLGCQRVTGLVAKKNKASRKLIERLGYTPEGCLKRALPDDDLMVYRLFKEDCKWLDSKTA